MSVPSTPPTPCAWHISPSTIQLWLSLGSTIDVKSLSSRSAISWRTPTLRATGTLVCFCLIAWRGLRITMRAQDAFGAFVALGMTIMIVVQAFVNMSVVLGLMPTKGIPLPLVSAGGSSLVVSLLGMGVLLNISQHETAHA